MLSIITLTICITLLILQVETDRRAGKFILLSVPYLFQIYFIIQLPLSSFFYEVFGWGLTDERITASISERTRTRMLMLVLLAYVAFFLGRFCVGRCTIGVKRTYSQNKNNATMYLIIGSIIIAGYWAFFHVIREYGGLQSFWLQIEHWRNIGLRGNGLYTNLISTVLPLASLIYMGRRYQQLKEKRLKIIIIQIILFILCLIPSVVFGFRSYLFSIILSHAVLFNLRIVRIPKKYYIVGALAFIVYFTAYSMSRSAELTGFQSIQYAIVNLGYSLKKILTRSRGSEIVCIQLDQMNGFRYSLDIFLDALISWIPRRIWSGKPTALSLEYSYTFFGQYGISSGISGTCVGEFYWEYGAVGMSLCMFVLGILFTLFHNTVMQNLSDERNIIYYSTLIWPLVRIAETPSSSFFSLTIVLIVLWVVTKFMYGIKLTNGNR